MDRRNFCLSSVAAVISGAAADLTWLPAVGQACAVTPDDARPGVPLHQFIFDRRYPAARAFGAAALHARSILGAVAIDGDITALWSRDLRLQWESGVGAVAGMTTARSLFCLEQLANEHWMRVVMRAEHSISQGHIAHRLTASEPMVAQMKSALAGENWPAQMPAALGAYPNRDSGRRVTCVVESAGRRPAMTDQRLVSFVIA
jgi:hypothetical protein